jgi:hypothetical protein
MRNWLRWLGDRSLGRSRITPQLAFRPEPKSNELVEGLRCLELTTVTTPQVEAAVRQVFPKGVDGMG